MQDLYLYQKLNEFEQARLRKQSRNYFRTVDTSMEHAVKPELTMHSSNWLRPIRRLFRLVMGQKYKV